MTNVEISKKTGYVLLNVLSDWLEYVDDLNEKTRQEIAALDDLITALDANEWYENLIEQKRVESQERHAKWAAEKAAKENN